VCTSLRSNFFKVCQVRKETSLNFLLYTTCQSSYVRTVTCLKPEPYTCDNAPETDEGRDCGVTLPRYLDSAAGSRAICATVVCFISFKSYYVFGLKPLLISCGCDYIFLQFCSFTCSHMGTVHKLYSKSRRYPATPCRSQGGEEYSSC
jgi:hypothetical protein